MFITNNHASFHFRRKKNLVKHQKVSKHYDHHRRFCKSRTQIFFLYLKRKIYTNKVLTEILIFHQFRTVHQMLIYYSRVGIRSRLTPQSRYRAQQNSLFLQVRSVCVVTTGLTKNSFRNNHLKMFYRIVVSENFAKFISKHLQQSLF